MEKINKLENVLDFYVNANRLKTDIIDGNYSRADNIFGSIILATTIDSEFRETDDLSKIYRMLILDEFSLANPYYDFRSLGSANQFREEIIEARKIETKDAKLVFKYKTLDVLLTKLASEEENIDELIKKGSRIISIILEKDQSLCTSICEFYYLNFKLKQKERSGWDSNHWNIKTNRIERVSEHVVSTMALAMIMNSEFEYDIDMDKVLKALAIHEVGETIIGDITPFDGITLIEKKELEHKAVEMATKNLKKGSALYRLFLEFDKHKTKESKFSYYCDKIEADLQSRLYQDRGLHNPLRKQKNNVVFKTPLVKKMLINGAIEPFDIWYEWDKSIYKDNINFPEFAIILNILRDNNLLNIQRVNCSNNIDYEVNKKHIKTLTNS